MHCPQVSSHIVFTVELLVADIAGIGLPVQMCCHIMPVEVRGVSVRVVADLAPVSIALLNAETPDADGIRVIGRGATSFLWRAIGARIGGATVPHVRGGGIVVESGQLSLSMQVKRGKIVCGRSMVVYQPMVVVCSREKCC